MSHEDRNAPVPVTGVWVRSSGDSTVSVLVEIDGTWRVVFTGPVRREESISHIVHQLGLRAAPPDPWTSTPPPPDNPPARPGAGEEPTR